jgi:hypothetical protein
MHSHYSLANLSKHFTLSLSIYLQIHIIVAWIMNDLAHHRRYPVVARKE